MEAPARSLMDLLGGSPENRRSPHGAAVEDPGDAYAGVPILQQPAWHNEVAAYFYFGGISSGAFMIGALAELAGPQWKSLAETANVVAFAAMLPCAPLLIDDLGVPARFHHMLRIFKPSSPMNLGTWTLVAHSGFSTLLAVRTVAVARDMDKAEAILRGLHPKLLAVLGFPTAMTLGGYSGVLIGTTSVPVWSTSSVLGGLFMASAVASGAAAVSAASMATGRDTHHTRAALGRIGLAAGVSELGLLAGYLRGSGEAAKPLYKGLDGVLLAGAATSSVLAVTAETVEARFGTGHRWLSALAAGATLAGGAMLRWAVVRAGQTSTKDRDANLHAMRRTARNPGWGPT